MDIQNESSGRQGIPIWQVDAFSERAFSGNPAAVCLLPEARDESWMRSVAAEMNLSETAFLHSPIGAVRGEYQIRYFTPTTEIPLCGHATLASAHVLYETDAVPDTGELLFHAPGGDFRIHRRDREIVMNFPSDIPVKTEIPPDFAMAFGFTARECYSSAAGMIAVLESPDQVRGADPDLGLMVSGGFGDMAITAPGEEGFDCVSRMFAPSVGIHEDPVTGSIHLALGQYWKKRLGKSRLNASQASERGGVLSLDIGDERSLISGRAVTVLSGLLHSEV